VETVISLLWIIVTLAALLAWPMARYVLVPLGQVKLATYATRLVTPWLSQDGEGRALLVGTLALYRRGLDPALLAWLEARQARLGPVGGAGVCAAGLLRAARGDLTSARALLRSVAWIHPGWTPGFASVVANEWLAADAASRGDWETVRDTPPPHSRAVRLLSLVAARRLGDDVPETSLRRAFRRAPRREALRPLIEPATPPPPRPIVPGATSPYRAAAAPPAEPLAAALRAHADTIAAPTAEGIRAAAAAWERALADPTLAAAAAERAAELGAEDGWRAFTDAISDELAAAALACDAPLRDVAGPVGEAAARRVQARVVADVEAAADALARRARDGRRLSPLDEWGELVELRRRHARAVALGDALTRHLLFPKVHEAACPLAVRMWNGGTQRPAAHTVFVWLLVEAEAAGHAVLALHERKNVACGVG